MKIIRNSLLLIPMLFATMLPLQAQRNGNNFNRGVRDGGRGGNYYYDDHRDYYHDDHRHDSGGIGPGKGAAIGGAGGAALGAIFGGGLKGALIGGAAGAGIGAIAGQANQNSKRNNYRHHR